MIIPPGYCNVQFLMLDATNNHQYMTAIGVHLEASDLGTLAADAAGAWEDNLAQFVGNEVAGTNIRTVLGTADPSEPLVNDHGTFVAGSASSDAAPPNVALLIRKRTELGGRRNRGRMFLPKPTESGIEEAGTLSSGQYSAFRVAVDAFYDGIAAADGVTEVSLFHSSPPNTPTAIVALDAQRMVATQRRRLRR